MCSVALGSPRKVAEARGRESQGSRCRGLWGRGGAIGSKSLEVLAPECRWLTAPDCSFSGTRELGDSGPSEALRLPSDGPQMAAPGFMRVFLKALFERGFSGLPTT